MKKKSFWILISIAVAGVFYFLVVNINKTDVNTAFNLEPVAENSFFELKKGDILVRPNSDRLPGSCNIPYGRRYGHVALVTEGATGRTVSEALEKAKVVEALFFDQATRKFQWKKTNQIREGSAIVSFGNRFKGIRFRLRTNITGEQADEMVQFARNQLNGGYNILSLKRKELDSSKIKDEDWHCATLVWEAYFLTLGLDLDANSGIFIYPSDIIANPVFNQPDGRVRF
jgi:hypothetical protein